MWHKCFFFFQNDVGIQIIYLENIQDSLHIHNTISPHNEIEQQTKNCCKAVKWNEEEKERKQTKRKVTIPRKHNFFSLSISMESW